MRTKALDLRARFFGADLHGDHPLPNGQCRRFSHKFMTHFSLKTIVLCLTVALGCDRTAGELSSEQAYVVAIYDDSAAMTDAGDKWGRAMEPWFHGDKAATDELEAADMHFKETIESVRNRIAKRTIPDNPKAKQFAKTVTEYLDWQMHTRKTYSKIYEVVRSENPAVIATRKSVIDELHMLNDEELVWKARIHELGKELGVTVGSAQ